MMLAIAIVVIATFFLLGAIWLLDRYVGPEAACVPAALVAIGAPALDLWPLALVGGGTFLLCVGCSFARAPRGTASLCAVALTVLAVGVVGVGLVQKWRELAQLAEEYPLVSLEDRLAAEAGRVGDIPAGEPQLEQAVQIRLDAQEQEQRRSRWRREFQLQRIHSDARAEFVLAQGFGGARMIPFRADSIRLPPLEPVPQPQLGPEDNRDGTPLVPPPGEVCPPAAPASKQLLALHDQSFGDFLASERMGFVKSRTEVAGFEPHRFRKPPAAHADDPWRIARIELIGLLLHPEPVVYVSEHLPNMSELGDAATRPLTEFEQSSLQRLRTDEDVVFDEGADRIRMVGSLRASKDCCSCHQVQRGELLGALSYVLVRTRRPAPATPKESAF